MSPPQTDRDASEGATFRSVILAKTRKDQDKSIRIAVYPQEPVTLGIGSPNPQDFSSAVVVLTQDIMDAINEAWTEAKGVLEDTEPPPKPKAKRRRVAKPNP